MSHSRLTHVLGAWPGTLAGVTLLGPYRPLHAPGWVGVALGWIAAAATGTRGLDYLTGPDSNGQEALSVVEAFGSSRQWGAWLCAGCLALAAALTLRRIGPLIVAHLVAVLVYAWYGIALAQGVAAAGDGIRYVTPIAANLALNVLCLILLGREVRRVAGPPTQRGDRWATPRP